MGLGFVNVPKGANFCNISKKRPLANERFLQEGGYSPRTTERLVRKGGDDCSGVLAKQCPKATGVSPWYGVYFHLEGSGLKVDAMGAMRGSPEFENCRVETI